MIDTIKNRFQLIQARNGGSALTSLEQEAFQSFLRFGIPTVKDEEWKYTRVGAAFNKNYSLADSSSSADELQQELGKIELPGTATANVLVLVNGRFHAGLSNIKDDNLELISFASLADHQHSLLQHVGNSRKYVTDGLQALNSSFLRDGLLIKVRSGQVVNEPLYIYHLSDGRTENILSQPRLLILAGANSQLSVVETYSSMGSNESFTNEIIEIVLERDAIVNYYKLQNDHSQAHHVGTTHFRQLGKSVANSVTISLKGGLVRNNLSISLEAERSEANLYGLYFIDKSTHVDNHTVVDHMKPHCESNELYKGVINDNGSAVFNGKIFVQPHAQKTNAFQSNKNVLLSENATVNTKPQLEIFADDVKCSHGCTVGQLDEESLFYLQSRGIPADTAKALLVQAFSLDVLEKIKLEPFRNYVQDLLAYSLDKRD